MNDGPPPIPRGLRVGRYRPHAKSGRPRQVRLRYTEKEYQAVERAAHTAGPTLTGYVADAALAAANSAEPPSAEPWRSALLELMDTRNQVRRIGVNLNQAARALNATGEAPPWIEHALVMAHRSLTRVDDAAAAMAAMAHRDGSARYRGRRSSTSPARAREIDEPGRSSGDEAHARHP